MQPNLSNDLIELRPLTPDDFTRLFIVASDRRIWAQHPVKNRFERVEFEKFFNEAIASKGTLVIIDKSKGKIIGSSRYNNWDDEQSEIEIGWTFLAREYWGGQWNRGLKILMLEHAFKFVNQVYLLVDCENIRSQRALEKIGAEMTEDRKNAEGVLHRCYIIQKDSFESLQ
jgi:RimJ/RimL family protein N-acetyltransferase